MAKIIAVTNRTLCREDFLLRIEKLAKTPVDGLILREKDLSESDYLTLAKDVLALCRRYGKECILHFFPEAALRLGVKKIQLPLWKAAGYRELGRFQEVGISVHSLEQAKAAMDLGAAFVTAGHVFASACKRDLAPRGLPFLQEVCACVPMPVLAIGGIQESNIKPVLAAGAAGVCLMSSLMICDDPGEYVEHIRSAC